MKNKLILTWMPWSWKTTISKKLWDELDMEVIDFDDDILEKISLSTAKRLCDILELKITPNQIVNKSVWNILKILWDKDFVRLEWAMWEIYKQEENTILSASWSLVLSDNAMQKLKQDASVIFIDTPIDTIMSRLEKMKVDRIVWMSEMTLLEILKYRYDFYKKTADYTFRNNNTNTDEDSVFKEFMWFIKNINS